MCLLLKQYIGAPLATYSNFCQIWKHKPNNLEKRDLLQVHNDIFSGGAVQVRVYLRQIPTRTSQTNTTQALDNAIQIFKSLRWKENGKFLAKNFQSFVITTKNISVTPYAAAYFATDLQSFVTLIVRIDTCFQQHHTHKYIPQSILCECQNRLKKGCAWRGGCGGEMG